MPRTTTHRLRRMKLNVRRHKNRNEPRFSSLLSVDISDYVAVGSQVDGRLDKWPDNKVVLDGQAAVLR